MLHWIKNINVLHLKRSIDDPWEQTHLHLYKQALPNRTQTFLIVFKFPLVYKKIDVEFILHQSAKIHFCPCLLRK
jgi:hypothetical protein